MRRLRLAVCGAGNRSRTVWQKLVRAAPERFELVGVQDPSPEARARSVALGHVTQEQTFAALDAMLAATRPDALLVCPIHAAHAAAIEAGLEAGCHVLVEKPFTTELSSAARLAALAEARDLRLGVVQNWRAKSVGVALRRAVQEGLVGTVSQVFFRYLRDRELPHLPGYLFEEEDPLLYAMAIHHLDLFRFALGQEVTRVSGHAARPSWSRYRHPSTVQLWLETDGGVAISYVATFSSRNAHLPLESLQVEGELGTLVNESAYSEPPLLLSRRGEPTMIDLTAEVTVRDRDGQYALADAEVLRNFHGAITAGEPLCSPARENLSTLAVLEAARRACHTGEPVDPRALLSTTEANGER